MKHTQTNIEWADFTFNPWRGCTKVSAGCANCYAETLSKHNPAVLGEWGPGKPRVLASDAMWKSPVKWNADAEKALNHWDYERKVCEANKIPYTQPKPERPRVFCASLGDWLDHEVPAEWLARLLDLIQKTPFLDWLLLTKRPHLWPVRMGDVIERAEVLSTHRDTLPSTLAGAVVAEDWLHRTVSPPNVWLGTSVEDQAAADLRIPQLLKIPAKVRFLSCEPLLGRVHLHSNHVKVETWQVGESFDGPRPLQGIHWVIAGGESGGDARPMHPGWVRDLRAQCYAAGLPFLFKQWGEHVPQGQPLAEAMPIDPNKKLKGHRFPDGTLVLRVGKKYAGRTLDGQIHHAFPSPAL
jgi:hypothetical protein